MYGMEVDSTEELGRDANGMAWLWRIWVFYLSAAAGERRFERVWLGM